MARKTVLVCDNCGKEVEEGKGAVLRLTYTDARRGAEAGGSMRRLRGRDARRAGRTARQAPEVRHRRLSAASRRVRSSAAQAPSGPSTGAVGPGLGWIGGPQPHRRARQRGQNRRFCWSGISPLCRRSRPRPGRRRARAHRAEPVGRRPGRARPPGAEPPALLGGSIGTFDDLFARIAVRRPRARPVVSRRAAQPARPPHSSATPLAERPRPLGALRRLRRLARARR